jgi:hypothetical protein
MAQVTRGGGGGGRRLDWWNPEAPVVPVVWQAGEQPGKGSETTEAFTGSDERTRSDLWLKPTEQHPTNDIVAPNLFS